MVRMRKKANYVGEAMAIANESSKRPRMEPGSVCNEETSPISTALPQRTIHLETHDGRDPEDAIHDLEQEVECEKFEHLSKGKAVPLVTRELVGESYKRMLDKIWSSLTKKNVHRLGIYGMGGVGKTELAKHVYNKFLEDSDYGHVYWVTVSPDFSIYKLQSAVAEALNLDLSNQVDVNIRAAILLKTLAERKKFVLIFDDVWSDIPLDSLGVPDDLNGCKIILITRCLDVCLWMGCQRIVEVDCSKVCPEEAWELFIKQLGKGTSLPRNVESVAKSIIKWCGGLPLMIISVGRRMRGNKSVVSWWNALEELKGSRMSGAYVEVFNRLKLSYDHLEDPSLQQCLLYCALFDQFYDQELIEHLIAETLVAETSSIRGKLNKGFAMLKQLCSACLLQHDDKGYVCMHELVRKMAFQIMNVSFPSLIEIGTKEIKYLPDKWHYMRNILRISFTRKNDGVLPDYFARCRDLVTLLLNDNWALNSIEDTYFDRFQELKVLNLSGSGVVALPISVHLLKKLRGLFLMGCSKLRNIPSLAKLESLEVLNLSFCDLVKQVPDGVDFLSNLKYIDLYKSGIDDSGAGVLARLIHLEYLAFDLPSKTVLTKKVAGLPKLEILHWRFIDISQLYTYFSETKKCRPIEYLLSVAPYGTYELGLQNIERRVLLHGCNISKELHIQKDTQMLSIRKVEGVVCA